VDRDIDNLIPVRVEVVLENDGSALLNTGE